MLAKEAEGKCPNYALIIHHTNTVGLDKYNSKEDCCRKQFLVESYEEYVEVTNQTEEKKAAEDRLI